MIGGPGAVEKAPELTFAVQGAEALRPSAVPTLGFDLRIERAGGGPVRSIVLAVQLRIAATRRPYTPDERKRLTDLFGRPEDWGRNLHSFLWTNETVVVPAFVDVTSVQLPVACTYDLEVAASKYFQGLEDGVVPLEFLFSGTVFYEGDGGRLRTAMLSWNSEATYRLPVERWREAIDLHFPGAAWLRLDRDSFERLQAFRTREALPSWEAAIDALLEGRS